MIDVIQDLSLRKTNLMTSSEFTNMKDCSIVTTAAQAQQELAEGTDTVGIIGQKWSYKR